MSVTVENFFEAIQQEYFISVIQPVITKAGFDINQEELMSDLQADLMRKVSIDEKKVSLNALELFTRDLGLDKCIKDLA
jgi:hypothetical protein